MVVYYSPILKAKSGEFRALKELTPQVKSRFAPMIDFDLPDEQKAANDAEQLANSARALARSNPPPVFFADAFQWAHDATVITGDHVVSFLISALRAEGLTPVPVIGYDRWESAEYRLAISNVGAGPGGRYGIRLDRSILADIYDPAAVVSTISSMLTATNALAESCAVFLDLGDVSTGRDSVSQMIDDFAQIIDAIQSFNFSAYVLVGSSVPEQIGLAVPQRDSTSTIMRKEQVAWRALRVAYPTLPLVTGDYGIRGPTSYNGPNPNMNGKIRYSADQIFHVARGHAISEDGSYEQMHDLASATVSSVHYRGSAYSWGDAQLANSAAGGVRGNMTTWIAIDTNHHIHAIVDEVIGYELTIVAVADAVI